MELTIVNPRPEYAPPRFAAPPAAGYLHLAAAIAPPTGPPWVRPNRGRSRLLTRLTQLAAELKRLPAVTQGSVYRAVLLPPTGRGAAHPARYDVAVLVQTTTPDVLDQVRATAPFQQLLTALTAAASDVHVMSARCLRYLGPVDHSRQGLFLFNHFTADDAQVATRLWEHLAGWYVIETGLTNSTLLAPIGASDYVFINHARWDKSLLRLAAEQFSKKTFRSYLRANLHANHVVAMPILYRLA